MAIPITVSNISTQWCTSFFAIIFNTNELSRTYFTLDGSDPITSPTKILYVNPFIVDAEGITTVKYYSISVSTIEANIVQTEYIKIDSVSPTSVINVNITPDGENGWYISLPIITITSNDVVSGINKIFYSWNGSSFQEYIGGSLTIPGEGIHYLQVYAIDTASNKEDIQTKIFKYDVNGPSTAITVPLVVVHEATTINFTVTDKASGVQKTFYTTDGSTPTIDSEYRSSFEIKDSGLYIIKYFSIDNAGNVESIKESIPFRIEIEKSSLQILITESFPTNGSNGWYKSSPQIGLLTTKPNLITELKYKIAPKNKPTTATYTSAVLITGKIDLSGGSFIALDIDQSGNPLVINVRGVDSTETSIKDIIDAINNTYTIKIATETGADGLAGSGYITLTSPTGGTGLPTSEIKFVSPGTFDATATVFGLDIDAYPHTFTETYLYVNYTNPFVLPGDGTWEVAATATTSVNETATAKKNYKIDATPSVTTVNVDPDHGNDFYTTSPSITFIAIDNASGVDKIIYQFDKQPTFEYHAEDGPVYLPDTSKIIRLVYFSIDVAGNIESPREKYFNFDDVKPTTITDGNNINAYNIGLNILFSQAKVVTINPDTHEYDFLVLTPSLSQNLQEFTSWSDLITYINALNIDSTLKEFTIDLSNNYVVTSILHNLSAGDVIQFNSSVMLPYPLLANRYYYAIVISSTQIRVADTYNDALSSIPITITNVGSGIHSINRAVPEIISFDAIKLFLKAIDDRQYSVVDEAIVNKDEATKELTVAHQFLYSISRVYNETTASPLTINYYSKNKIYTNEVFLNSDVIVVDYIYTGIQHTYYGVNATPQIDSGIIDLVNNDQYTIKYFSIDEAGNEEAIQTFPVTVTILNRAPIINAKIVKSSDTLTDYLPNGENSWYKTDEIEPLLRPAVKIEVTNPDVYVFNEDSLIISISGTYNIQFTALRVDTLYEVLSDVTRIENITKGEIYTIVSFSGNLINATCSILPQNTDVFQVDYQYSTLLNYNPNSDSRIIKIGDIHNPDVDFDFSDQTNPYVYPEPSTYDIQGEKDITIIATNKRNKTTVCTMIPQLSGNTLKLDTYAPISTDNAITGWVDHDVSVDVTSHDFDVLPVEQSPSGVNRILYSTDGADPNIAIFDNVCHLTLSSTGQFVVKYRGVDNAGNFEDIKSSVSVQIDKTAPETIVVVDHLPDGQNDWYIVAPTITLDAQDPDSGIDKTFYKWDNTAFYTIYSTSILIPSEGTHTLYFYSKDNVGNIETVKQQIFKLDINAPVTHDNVTGNWTNNQTVQFTIDPDASGLYRTYYTFALDPLPLPDPTIASPYTINGRMLVPASGTYNIKYFSVDMAGNVEIVKSAVNKLYLDLEKPIVVSIDPPDLIFTIQTHLTVDFTDALSGVDVDTVKIVVDDVEYSTSKNASYFSFSGTSQSLQVKVGPVASIPNFDNLESLVIYANDFAGNALVPVAVTITPPDVSAPYIKGFWPKHKAFDVSRDSNVMFFIDDDMSGVDIRTVSVKIANTIYELSMTDIISVAYSGQFAAFIDIFNYNMFVTVGGVVIASVNLTHDEYSTVKKVSVFLSSLPNFIATMIDKSYDQITSLDFINLNHIAISNTIQLSVARFEDNKNIVYTPRSRGYLIAITPFETFEDNYTVNVIVNASDFSGHQMTAQQFLFTCKEVATPSRNIKNKWFNYHVDIVNRILSNLESTYNTDSQSTVFYGYFKTLALEIARSMQTVEDYRNDSYYETGTAPELLYQNLGYLLKFEPRADYSHDRYRDILLILMQMFFKGSTKSSITEGLTLLLGVQSVTIKEYLQNIAWQFIFSFDVEIGSIPIKNWDEFNSDITTVLKLVKPAHTYFLLRYIFSEIIRTKDIIDEIVKWHFHFKGEEDVRTNCANKYKKAEVITENVTAQFDGSNNCCFAYYKPILSLDETKITSDPIDIQVDVTPVGLPISVISVNGFTGKICLSRNPLTSETVKIIYKFNKYVIYRELRFYLNTYTITGGVFDLTKKSLLNQTNVLSDAIIAYNIPEQMHAHICETALFSNVNYGVLEEKKFRDAEEQLIANLKDFKSERVKFDIRESLSWKMLLKETVDMPDEQLIVKVVQPYSERVNIINNEYGFAHETNAHPFTTNDLDSLTNNSTDMLFYWIKRFFGG
jgi:hypothetical protein